MCSAMVAESNGGIVAASSSDHHHRETSVVANPEVKPFDFLEEEDEEGREDTLLVMLNHDIEKPADEAVSRRVKQLWRRSTFRACVDGGLKMLHAINESIEGEERFTYAPHLVTGDFDSASPQLLDLYRARGAEVRHTPDQDSTDFAKCVALIGRRLDGDDSLERVRHVVALAGASQRFDHSMSNLNTLFQSLDMLPERARLYLVEEGTVTTALRPGLTTVRVPQRFRAGWCTLLPVKGPTRVRTEGLRYDLSGCELEMGRRVVKYNRTRGDFTVTCDNEMILAMQVLPSASSS